MTNKLVNLFEVVSCVNNYSSVSSKLSRSNISVEVPKVGFQLL